jgi:hypothetical protein
MLGGWQEVLVKRLGGTARPKVRPPNSILGKSLATWLHGHFEKASVFGWFCADSADACQA